MQQRSRRYVLLLSVVMAGSILVFLDTPLPILISATFLIGFLVMVLTGSIHLGGRKEQKKQESPLAEKISPVQKTASGSKTSRRPLLSRLSGSLAAFKAGMARFRGGGKDTGAHIRKLDELLDEALADNPIPPQELPAPQRPSSGGEVDPFMALSSARLEDELLASEGESEDGLGDLAQLDVSLQREEAPIQIEEESDEVNEILKTYENELTGFDDLGNIDALAQQFEGLEDVDLGDLDPEPPDSAAPGAVAPPEAPGSLQPPAPAPEKAEPSGMLPAALQMPGEDMLAFASGGSGKDDLLSALKADSAAVSKGKDMSLIRDLKDEKVDIRELERELEETLQKLKKP